MVVYHNLMQGSHALPQRLSQQSLAVVQSSRSLTPELVGAFRICHLQRYQECKPPGDINSQAFLRGRIDCAKGADLVNEFCPGGRIVRRGLSLAEYAGIGRMRGNSFASLSSCSHPSFMTLSIPHRAVAINGQTLDHTSWESLVSVFPGPFPHNPALPWSCLPSGALRGLKMNHYGSAAGKNHYGSVAGKKSGQDLLVRDSDKCSEKKLDDKAPRSEKDSVTALYSSECDVSDEKEKKLSISGKAVTGCEEDSESGSEDDEEDMKKEQKKEKKMGATQEKEEDSDSDSDDDKEDKMKKKSMSKGKVEVVGMCEEDSDSDSDSDEEKEMKKKMKANEKEMKKQAKKEKRTMKAMKKMEECEDSDGKDGDKKKEKMVTGKYSEDLEESDSAFDYHEHEGEEDDVVEVISDTLNVDEVEEEDFELVGDEDLVEEIENEIEDDFEEFEDEDLDDDFWEEEEGEAKVGDGGDGGGVVLGETKWGSKALELAKEVVGEMGTEFSIFAFKVSPDGIVRVRLDKLSDKYGSPTMTDIEKFSRRYSEVLDNSETIPESVAVEVSSPGAERIVNVPDDLERFKQLPMYVQYFEDETGNEEKDGVLELDSVDPECRLTVWKLANVKINREQSGKGRPLNSKQRKWRAHVPVNSLKLVRLYLDV